MEVLAAYLACVLVSLVGVRLGVPEAYHTIKDRQHAACLVRTAALEVALGIAPDPILELREATPEPVRTQAAVRQSDPAPSRRVVGLCSEDEWIAQVKRWEKISRKANGKPLSDDEAVTLYYQTRR